MSSFTIQPLKWFVLMFCLGLVVLMSSYPALADPSKKAEKFFERGVSFMKKDNCHKALKYFYLANSEAESLGTILNIGVCRIMVGDYQLGELKLLYGLELAEFAVNKEMIGQYHTNLGTYYRNRFDFDKAEYHFYVALGYMFEKDPRKYILELRTKILEWMSDGEDVFFWKNNGIGGKMTISLSYKNKIRPRVLNRPIKKSDWQTILSLPLTKQQKKVIEALKKYRGLSITSRQLFRSIGAISPTTIYKINQLFKRHKVDMAIMIADIKAWSNFNGRTQSRIQLRHVVYF